MSAEGTERLRRRLAEVRVRTRGATWGEGLCRVFAALTAALFLQFVFDWGFSLPYAGRLCSAAVFFGATGVILVRRLYRPLKRVPDDDELALRVEDAYPELDDRLISAIQLSRREKLEKDNPQAPYRGSPSLLVALEHDAARAAEPLDFLKVVRFDALRRQGLIAGGALVFLLCLSTLWPAYAAAVLARLVSPGYSYPTRTRFEEIKFRCGKLAYVESPVRVPHGDELIVEVRVDAHGWVPAASGNVEFRMKDGLSVRVELERKEQTPFFIGRLAKALESAEAVVRVGDAVSASYRVDVLPRPEVLAGDVTIYPPTYLAQQPPLSPAPLTGFGGLRDGRARIRIQTGKPLREAVILRPDGRSFPLRAEDDSAKKWLIDDYPLDKSTRLEFALTDQEGLENGRPAPSYAVEVKPDLPPTVVMLAPTRDATIVPHAQISIQHKTTDDYGVEKMWVGYRLEDEVAGDKTDRLLLPPDSPQRERVTWKLASLGLKPGQRVVFWLEAEDACPTNNTFEAQKLLRVGGRKPQPDALDEKDGEIFSRSNSVTLTVVSVEAKDLELTGKIAELYMFLETIKEVVGKDVLERIYGMIEALKAEQRDLRNP